MKFIACLLFLALLPTAPLLRGADPKMPALEEPPPRKATRQKSYDKDAGPRPDLEDVSYGSHERLKLDLWKAKSSQPTPLLVFFHGGGGDKLMYRGNRLLAFCLANLPPDRARMLLGWKHSGFNVHCSKRVHPHQKEDLERLAQYIIRNPFSVEKMHPDPETDTIVYRSGMNPKIRRNFEIFTPCELPLALLTANTVRWPVSLRSADRRHHSAYSRKKFSARALLWLVLKQDAWAAQQAGRKQGRGRGADR